MKIQHKILDEAEEFNLIQKWQKHHDQKAFKVVFDAFYPFIIKIVKRYKNYLNDSEEVLQEAILGFITALDKFDLERGIRFSYYAKFWINCHCQDAVIRNWSIVRSLKTSKQKKIFFSLGYLQKQIKEIENNLKQEIEEKIINEMQMNLLEIQKTINTIENKDYSIDMQYEESNYNTVMNTLKDDGLLADIVIEKQQTLKQLNDVIEKSFSYFNEKELFILNNRIFNKDNSQKTLAEIANHCQISTEKTRQIEKKALRKLQKILILNGFKIKTLEELRI